jgi:uncharacterized protein (DUF1697 family)
MPTYAALLRGINVGGNKKVPMKDLVVVAERLGHTRVSTYVQSGNLIFSSPQAPEKVVPALEAAIERRFGFTVPVVLRTHEALVRVARAHPFAADESEPKYLNVVYLSHAPARADVARLDPDRSPGERYVVKGAEIYMHNPKGVAGSKLTVDYFLKTLGTQATARNWNTVLKLAELTAG